MSKATLVWVTPNSEQIILKCARVSSENPDSKDTKLLKYLIKHKHWSPFDLVYMCVEIVTSRDISAQLIRHKSFSFQEFSQRYAVSTAIEDTFPRRQDTKNRQNSIDDLPTETLEWWHSCKNALNSACQALYTAALKNGIAKECARRILPMATQTKVYMCGSVRSWIHYLDSRLDPSTQLEHRLVAKDIEILFKQQFPIIYEAINNDY